MRPLRHAAGGGRRHTLKSAKRGRLQEAEQVVSQEEIQKVAELMRIKLSDHSEHVERVQKILAYFDILDGAGVEDEEVTTQEIAVGRLREDEHAEHPDRLIDRINNYKGAYVRAPKMM